MPIIKQSTNLDGETFWFFKFPSEHIDMEIGMRADVCGIWFGDDYISWDQIDTARGKLNRRLRAVRQPMAESEA